jgi:hypothetical protein
MADTAKQPGVWEHTFGEASTPVRKLGRVQAPKGVYLRERPLPGAPSPSAPVPFNGLVFVERRTNQGAANERWCYVIATELGIAGFCEERYLAIDPPEPTATLHRTVPGERLATIAEQAYGPAIDDANSRLYGQALYLACPSRTPRKCVSPQRGADSCVPATSGSVVRRNHGEGDRSPPDDDKISS